MGILLERQKREALASSPCPEVPEDLLVWLEAKSPPRCYDPDSESHENHLRYAGGVKLIEELRNEFDKQRTEAVEMVAYSVYEGEEGDMD